MANCHPPQLSLKPNFIENKNYTLCLSACLSRMHNVLASIPFSSTTKKVVWIQHVSGMAYYIQWACAKAVELGSLSQLSSKALGKGSLLRKPMVLDIYNDNICYINSIDINLYFVLTFSNLTLNTCLQPVYNRSVIKPIFIENLLSSR